MSLDVEETTPKKDMPITVPEVAPIKVPSRRNSASKETKEELPA